MLQTAVSILRGRHWLVTFDDIKHCELLQDVPPPGHLSCSFDSIHYTSQLHLCYLKSCDTKQTHRAHCAKPPSTCDCCYCWLLAVLRHFPVAPTGGVNDFFFLFPMTPTVGSILNCISLQGLVACSYSQTLHSDMQVLLYLSLQNVVSTEISHVGLSDQKKTSKPCPAQQTACKRLPSVTAAPSIYLSVSWHQ